VNILTRLNKREDPHLVKLLLTMEIEGRPGQCSSYFLMFPYADGNLRQFWQQHLPYASDENRVTYARWAAIQFYGLAWALCKLHDLHQREVHRDSTRDEDNDVNHSSGDRFYGIHGDIKPENLLWYEKWVGPEDYQECPNIIPPHKSAPFGVLQLADFGISKLHNTATRSNFNMKWGTKTYAPPERESDDEECSRSFDIWSLGCVFLEFLCWLVHGGGDPNPVDEFQKKRRLNGKNKTSAGTTIDTFYRLVEVGTERKTKSKFEVNPAVMEVRYSMPTQY